MFTGIIKEIGLVKKVVKINTGLEIEISCRNIISDIRLGDSISVNGVPPYSKKNLTGQALRQISRFQH